MSDDLTPVNRLQESSVYKVDDESEIGEIHLAADLLFAVLLVNKEVAAELRDALNAFLNGDAPPVPEKQH